MSWNDNSSRYHLRGELVYADGNFAWRRSKGRPEEAHKNDPASFDVVLAKEVAVAAWTRPDSTTGVTGKDPAPLT